MYKYPYGASYYPLMYPQSEWEKDLSLMAQAGINLLRTGDVHGGWDRIEPRPGDFQWEVLGRFYGLAAKYGISILMTTGIASPPLWLLSRHPDVQLVSSRGEKYPFDASYHWACIHNPGFLAEAGRYTEALARFCLEQPNHFGWQITNEIGFPFMPTREEKTLDLFCYCQHSQEEFRSFIKEKYKTLDNLSENWTWSTTALVYNSWDEVKPPEVLPKAWSGVTRWLDWRLFWQHEFAQFVRWQQGLLKKIDPQHPTSVNTFNFKGYDRFGTFTGLDQWQLVKETDHVGYDLYPGTGNKLATRPEHNSIFLDHGRSVNAAWGKDFWIHELESGPVGGWVLGPEYNTGTVDILRNGFECLGHGVKLMLYMGWKEWEYQSLGWGGVVTLESEPRKHFDAVSQLGSFISKNSKFLLAAQVTKGEAAIVESKANAIFFRGIDQEEALFHAQRGAYSALHELGYRVDFITPEQLQNGYAKDYKVICLPLMALTDDLTNQALLDCAQGGAVVVGFSRCGMMDQRGWYRRRHPVPQLAEIFGHTVTEVDRADNLLISFESRDYPGTQNFEKLTCGDSAEILAVSQCGFPAVTANPVGKGWGLYFATMADYGYGRDSNPFLKRVLAAFLQQQLEIYPEVRLDYPNRLRRELDPHVLEGEDRTMVIITNYIKQGDTCSLVLPTRGEVVHVHEVFPGEEPLNWNKVDKQLHVSVNYLPQEAKVIEILWGGGD